MTTEDAVALIIAEAREGNDSLITNVRAGQDPGPERMRELILALRTVFRSLAKRAELDRHLAAALYTLGSDVPLTISSLASKGQAWRKEFMEQEIYELLIGVQGIFEDRWLEPEPDEIEPKPSETIH